LGPEFPVSFRREERVGDASAAFAFLVEQIADAETQWSLGTFGAIAEFMRDADEPAVLSHAPDSVSVVTPRGGMRISPGPDMRIVAFETTTRESWSQRVALCLPGARSAMHGHAVLTELGPDRAALQEQDRDAILFDLGLEARQADICVRVADASLLASLRACAGRPVFAPDNPAMGAILAANPPRVFITRLGRIEVYQPIPKPDEKSPEGPHTHVLPTLLHHRRTHAATEPIPDGWVPCAYLYPPHPARDGFGNSRPFDAARHRRFQDILRRFGHPDVVALKQQVAPAIAAGEEPATLRLGSDRFARTNVRVSIRQLRAADDDLPALPHWIAAHERAGFSVIEDEAERHHR
jgi:hypothetical protein